MEEFVFLLDVDNTLIDNDRVKENLQQRINDIVGEERGEAFWDIYEEVRKDLDYVDFPETLSRFIAAFRDERHFPQLADLLLGYPYYLALFPNTLQTLGHLREMGTAVIVSDGDPVFQPAKISRAGLAAAVDDNVLIFVHKEGHLDEITSQFPARRYVLVDDKPGILTRSKARLGERIVTVQVRQGKYAEERAETPPDLEVQHIGDLRHVSTEDLRRLAGLVHA